MTRPWRIWITFLACLTVLLGVMAWQSYTVVRLERDAAAARRQAEIEEPVRLALWRMESSLAALIARERARPYFAYSSFYPAERAYTRMFREVEYGEILVPSPLLTQVSPYISLHFQISADGHWSSPQVPTGTMRDLAAPQYTSLESIDRAVARLDELSRLIDHARLATQLPLERVEPISVVRAPIVPAQQGQLRSQQVEESFQQQVMRNTMEDQARSRAVQQLDELDGNIWNERAWSLAVTSGMLHPIWCEQTLLLARRVSVDGWEYIQGCQLDWPALDSWLCGQISDLFPQARLEPVSTGGADYEARVLAALPVRLIPGEPALSSVPLDSPLRLSLVVAWGCVLLSAVAVAVLLIGTVSLSERRGAFVSAVTHELRTPLTTFKLYTEMLAEGMVTDEHKRREYLDTLQAEANRLSHLVENVLAYARLERGRAGGQLGAIGLSDLLARVSGRLAERADQARMQLVVADASTVAESVTVRTDVSVVEQILLNLVDNACKYAADADQKLIHVSADVSGQSGVIRIRDHGPGISANEARRLFQPFRKSARQAANSAPGIGLGLALSRRLARALGGDLRLVDTDESGACLELTLPRIPPAQ
ncbi:MAG: HAMP domain-containing sensor histidine kinase [Planctomycetota bacterium]